MATSTAPQRHGRASVNWSVWIPLGACALSLVLALLTIGERDLWYDEAFSVTSTNQLLTSLVRRSGSMGLYYAMLTPWSKVSLDPAWLRLPSAVFAAASVGLASRFAFVYFGRTAGLWSAALLVPTFGVLRYAQEARSYALVMLLAVASWFLIFRLSDENRRSTWVWWGVCAAALAYSHPIAALIPASQLLAWRERNPDLSTSVRSSVPGWLTAFVLLLPMMATFGLRTGAQPGWIPPLSMDTIGEGIGMIAGPDGMPHALLAIGVLLASWRLATRHEHGEPEAKWRDLCILLWIWVTPVVLVLISLAQPMFMGRYLIASLPAVAIALATTISDLPRRGLQVATGSVLVIALVPGVLALHRSTGHEWTEAIAHIEAQLSASERHGVAFNFDEVRQAFEVNAANNPILTETTPIAPSERWGTNLRYHEDVDPEEFAAAIDDVDVLWEVGQLFGGRPPLPQDRFEHLGFCQSSEEQFSLGIFVARFDQCQ